MKRTLSPVLALVTALVLALGGLGAQNAQAASYPAVQSGQSGANVSSLQYLLKAQGSKIDADGKFGAATKSAVVAFQKAHKLSSDGVAGEDTWTALTAGAKVRNGSKGDAVRAAQVQLNKYGNGLSVDGIFGAGTVSATKKFQSSKGLGADGIIGPDTWRALVTGSGSGSTPAPGGNDRVALAKQLLANKRVVLMSDFCAPHSPLRNMQQTARGEMATGSHGNAYLSTKMLQFMRDLGQKNGYRVTCIQGGTHSATSYHYRGRAVDIDLFDGQKINMTTAGRNASARLRALCKQAGAIENLGPGDPGHSGHVHCAF